MKILFAGVELSNWTEHFVQGVAVNGVSVADPVDIVRAARKRYFSRANQAISLTF